MTPNDLARLHARCFDSPPPWSARAFADLLASPAVDLLATSGGFALIRTILDETELLTLATDPAHRRQGIARHLLAQACARATARGAQRMQLEVAADNTAARALYAASGFVETGRRPGYYASVTGDAPVDALNLCKRL